MPGERRSLQSLKRKPSPDDLDFIDLTATPKRHQSSAITSWSSSPIIVTDSPSPLPQDPITTPKQQWVLPAPSSPSPSPSAQCVDPPHAITWPGNEFQPDPNGRANGKAWLASMYVVDMRNGFVAMDSPSLKQLPVTKRLEKVFGWPVPSRTFYDQRERWHSATDKEREDALAAGYSPEGLWSVFASNIP